MLYYQKMHNYMLKKITMKFEYYNQHWLHDSVNEKMGKSG
jgi:hypothetical protein